MLNYINTSLKFYKNIYENKVNFIFNNRLSKLTNYNN